MGLGVPTPILPPEFTTRPSTELLRKITLPPPPRVLAVTRASPALAMADAAMLPGSDITLPLGKIMPLPAPVRRRLPFTVSLLVGSDTTVPIPTLPARELT